MILMSYKIAVPLNRAAKTEGVPFNTGFFGVFHNEGVIFIEKSFAGRQMLHK